MQPYVYFEDLPKAQRKQLSKEVFRRSVSTRLWSGLCGGMSCFLGTVVSASAFPDTADWPGQLLYAVIITLGLFVLLEQAVVQPKIIRLVERKINAQSKSADGEDRVS